MKKNKLQVRQGDVLVIAVDKIPEMKQTKRVRLANGEVTGHHHTISDGAVGFAEAEEDLAEFFAVKGGDSVAVLTHQEHSAIEIPEGEYRSVIQSEYTPQAIKRVQD